jgi:hypothetical protein
MTTNDADTLVHEIGATGEFTLKLPAGEIELHGHDQPTVTVRDLDGRALDDRFVIDRGSRHLGIRMRNGVSFGLGFSRDNGRARLRVDLPAASTVVVETASAGITAERLQREQRYRSASGRIRVTGSGTLTIDNVSGDVRIAADGDVELAARVVSGAIQLDGGRLLSAVVSTTSGDVVLDSELVGPGPYGIQSVSGDARVRAAGSLKVEAKTLTGMIDSAVGGAFGRKTRKGRGDRVIGDGRNVLTFKSISGDLRVTDSSPASGASLSHGAPEPPAPPAPAAPPSPPEADDARLVILRDLEEGRIDVTEATTRLAAIDGDDDV